MLVVIMRGVPGSGKSTTAFGIKKHIENYGGRATICSNDLYPGYFKDAEHPYDWTPQKAKEAKKFCQDEFLKALKDKPDVVIVDNCHLTHRSYSFYKREAEAAGCEISYNVLRPNMELEYINKCAERNKHNVNARIIYDMVKSWED